MIFKVYANTTLMIPFFLYQPP